MSNLVGKTLLEAKRLGENLSKSTVELGKVISKSSGELGNTVGEVLSSVSSIAKKSAKISMLKAEIDENYQKLGRSVFENGLTPDNEEGLEILHVLFDKYMEMQYFQELLKNEKGNAKTTCDCGCEDCEDSCDCENSCDCEDSCDCHECNEDKEVEAVKDSDSNQNSEN